MFQSYFIQDYRWKNERKSSTRLFVHVSILLHSGLPLEDAAFAGAQTLNLISFNPTSFRITVGRASIAHPSRTAPRVSILLHSGLPLEEVSAGFAGLFG